MEPKPRTRRLRCTGLAAALALSLLAWPSPGAEAATPSPPTTAGPIRASVCGTWVLHQVTSLAQLERDAADIDAALAAAGTMGLSLRVPWSAIDGDLSILDRGEQLARARAKRFSVRFMAGRYTPARIFDAGAHYFKNAAGQKIPKPFGDTGQAGNPVFEREFDILTGKLAAWSRAHDARLLHLAWYGYNWSEIYNDADLQTAPGYSPAAWVTGHNRLVDIAHRYSGPDLAVEFPLSGYWGGMANLSNDLTAHMLGLWGDWSDQVYLQGNGLGMYNGKVTQKAIWTAKQMFNVGDWDWAAAYDVMYAQSEQYVEVYLSSFTGANRAQLASESQEFDTKVCAPLRTPQPPPPPPPPPSPPTDTAPTAPTGLRAAAVNGRSFELHWQASTDDVAVTGYRVTVNGNAYKTVPWTGIWVSPLVPNTSYDVSVVALDGAGHQSPPARLTVRTGGLWTKSTQS